MATRKTTYLTKRVMFSSMHELGNPQLTPEENRQIFGKCYRTHGHDYHLEVTVRGEIDSNSGLCCDRDRIDAILEVEIVKRFNGVHLNRIFKSTSGEDLAREFYDVLKGKVQGLVMVRLQETPKNFFIHGDEKTPISDFRFLMY